MVAGLRLVLTERRLRRLFFDYIRSAQARENISPRVVVGDLFCLAALLRPNGHAAETKVDSGRRRILVRSLEGPPDGSPPSAGELERLLSEGAWEFLWDHSVVGGEIEYPVLGARTITLELHDGKQVTLPRDQPRRHT